MAPDGDAPKRALRPVDAASLILLDRSGGAPRALVGRRSSKHVFMPSTYVFPGGRVDASDGSIGIARGYRPEDERRLLDGMRARATHRRARALGVAALREMAEETSIVLGEPDRGTAGQVPPHFAARSVAPALAPLRYVARATTPPGRTRRFDTRFFACFTHQFDGNTVDPRDSDELADLRWMELTDETLDMPRITRVILGELTARLRADPDLTADQPVPHHHMRHRNFVRVEE